MAFYLLRSSLRLSLQAVRRPTLQHVRKDSIFTKYREPPNGFLFNRKPLKPGEKREREDWEYIWYGMWSLIILTLVVGSYFHPKEDILTWARKEAEIRVAEIDAAEAAVAAEKEQ